jgi:hypothetical protein
MSKESCIAAALGVSEARESDLTTMLGVYQRKGYVASYILQATTFLDTEDRVLLAYMLGRMVSEGKIRGI